MFSFFARAAMALGVGVFATASAGASPSCLRDHKPYKLDFDTIEWSMTIAPGADCIQGLRWSTMQIYWVNVAKQPKNGEIVIVGSGFRYIAKPDFSGTDKFTLTVVGKNRRTEGASTVEVTVSRPTAQVVAAATHTH
ncbi:Ig-like domain-containing protein [Bradyrhizobium symbiodeficiens]|uniref:Ig-like domain-containing protein n=1 Tax=Bradyrhizobium symbiodeficiens TaxID=1404367 RepID=UPI0030D581B2